MVDKQHYQLRSVDPRIKRRRNHSMEKEKYDAID